MKTDSFPETIQDKLDVLRSYWLGQRKGILKTRTANPVYRQMLDHYLGDIGPMAKAAAKTIKQDLNSDDPLVLPAVFCDFGTISTAKLYGGTILPPEGNGSVHIEPRFKTPDELVNLTPCPFEKSDFQLAVDLYQQICRELDSDNLFLRTPDFQGPLNTLALVMDQQEMLMAMYTDPDAIHKALDAITDTLIDYNQRLRRELGGDRVIGNIWPYTFLPEDLGVSITQDMMPLLSADLYDQFEIPHLKRISDTFGGVLIHCCGTYAQHLNVLKNSGINILGLEFHHPFTKFEDIYAVFGDDIVYVPFLFHECKDYPNYDAFIAHLQAQASPDTRFWLAQTQQ